MELLAALLLMSAIMTGAWAVRLRTGQSGWIDACWSGGSGLAALLLALAPLHDVTPRQWLCAVLAGAWSFRLAGHIAARTAKATRDDPRYAALVEQWGANWKGRLLLFLQVQAVCGFGLAISVWAAAHAPRGSLGWQDWLGVAILGLAVAGEAVADAQLRGHARKHRGGIADTGLWAWSRHPNYFFEWLGWWAYVAIAIAPGYWQGWLALIGPAMMYWLLVHASGIPPLEAHMEKSRGEKWRAYKAKTSAFFPLPPRT
ncbi:MAG TPA: DUF1295 domain-containing protein [Allosphingosinicella sp.]|nr:DUF1295 domain-containing protein [Allosphingosinicella sp.]